MKKKTVVIIECRSSAAGYIGDIRKYGYEPLLVETAVPEEERAYNRWLHDKYYSYSESGPAEIIEIGEDYADALARIAALEPEAILPGSDEGVELAARLSADLGLKGNDPKNLPQMRDKELMQEALKNAGLRYIRGRKISTVKEALDFRKETGVGKVVIKPASGEASIGVCICDNEEEIRKAIELNQNLHLNGNGFLIQEFIDGQEYIVDMVSCGGKQYPTIAFNYSKTEIPGAGKAYNLMDCAWSGAPEFKSIVDYAKKATQAIGYAYGASHSEYMVDKDGPVLIEINCRVCGALLRGSFLDQIFGYHETEVSLRSVLYEDSFDSYMKGLPDHLLNRGCVRFLVFDRDRFVKRSRLQELKEKLRTFKYEITIGENMLYKRTIDLSTAAGMIYLAGDEEAVKKDLEIIDDLEKNHLDELFSFS